MKIIFASTFFRLSGLKTCAKFCTAFWAFLLLSCTVNAQVKEIGQTTVQPVPEIKRLYDALGGEWNVTEHRDRTQFFPNGGEREGRTFVRLAAGGAVLVIEGHSDGSAGALSHMTVIWWNQDAKVYPYFTCFKASDSGCEVRGTAQWKGNDFVNDYEEVVDGKKLKFRDTFQEITANTFSLVCAWVKPDGSTEPVISSRLVRRIQK